MATRQIETWNETAASNDFSIDEGGAPPAHARTKVDDSNRQRMSAMASFYQDGIEWLDLLRNPTDRSIQYTVSRQSATVIRIISGSTDLTTMFNVGRRLRTTTAGATTEDVEVLSVAHSDPNFDITIYSAGGDTITAGIDGLLLNSGASLGRFAFQNTLPSDYIVMDGLTDADFVVALAAVPAAGGTILLLAGDTVLTQSHTVPDKTRIIGQGVGSSILSTADKTLARLLYQASGTGFTLESFTITTPVTTTSGNNHVVELGTCTKVRIKDIFFDQSYGAAIKFTGVSHSDVVIEGCEFYRNRGGCVISPDTNTDVDRCFIRDCGLREPGFSHTGTSYGLQLAGKWNCSGIQITELDNGGATIPIGIEFSEKLAASPNEKDANHCSLSNFSITGTGQNARGVDLNGRYCSVTDGAISLSGTGSTGVKVAGALGSQLAQNNRTANVSFVDCAIGYDEPNTAAIRNSVVGCAFENCGVDVRLGATLASVTGCTMDGATTQSISIVAGAVRTLIQGNTIYNNTGNGITVANTADRTRIMGNVLDTCAGDGVNVVAGSTNTRVSDNHCIGVVGSNYENGATTNAVFRRNHPFFTNLDVSREGGTNMELADETHTNIPGMTGFLLPAESEGRTINWRLTYHVLVSDGSARVYIRAGTTGTVSDPSVANRAVAVSSRDIMWTGSFVGTGEEKIGLGARQNDLSGLTHTLNFDTNLRFEVWYDEED